MGRRRSGFGKFIRVRIEPCMTKFWEKKVIELKGWVGGAGGHHDAIITLMLDDFQTREIR